MFRTSEHARLIDAKIKPSTTTVEKVIIFVYQYPQTQMDVSLYA